MEFLSEIRWLNLFWAYTLKTSLILSLALLLSRILKKQSAAVRHLVLSSLFISMLFLPILSLTSLGWETRLLPAWGNSEQTARAENSIPVASALNFSPRVSYDNAADLPDRDVRETPSFSANLGSVLTKAEGIVDDSVLLIWTLGLGLLISRLALGLWGAYRLTREGIAIKESIWKRLLDRFLTAISIKRRVSLMSHTKVQVPLTWGLVKPVVMMPAETEHWTDEQRSSALFHELSHVKRGDFLAMLLVRFNLALFWFNPLSWAVFRSIKKEQEKACDELVIKAGIKPSTYAAHLLAFRRSLPFHWNPPTSVLGAMGKTQLDDRLTTILKQRMKLKEISMKSKIMLGILAVLTVSFVGMARPSSSAVDETVADVWIQDVEQHAQQAVQSAVSIPAEVQEQKQEQKKTQKTEEQAKEEEKSKQEETTLVWTAKEGEEGELEITIVEKDGKKKTFTVSSPTIYISRVGKEGKSDILNSHVLELKPDEKGNYTIVRTGKVKLEDLHLQETKNAIKLEDGAVVTIKTKGSHGEKVIHLDAPEIHVKTVHADPDIKVHVTHTAPDVQVATVHVEPEVHVEAVDAEPDFVAVRVHPRESVHVEDPNKEQVKKIEEILKRANEGSIEKEEALKQIEETVKEIKESPKALFIERSDKAHAEGRADIWVTEAEKGNVIVSIHDEGEATIVFHAEFDKEHKEEFEKAIAKLKTELPEGYGLKADIDEDPGSITMTISGLGDEKDREGAVKKIIDLIKKELAHIK